MSTLLVAAGVLIKNNSVLLTQRKPGSHLAGSWEFPGGKIEDGEEPREALARELAEELGIHAVIGDVIEVTFHRYPERSVLLIFYAVSMAESSNPPRLLDVSALHWASRSDLDRFELAPADHQVLGKVRRMLV